MDALKFKTINGVNIVELNNVLQALTLSVNLDPVRIEHDNIIDIETSNIFTDTDKNIIIPAMEALGPIHFNTYVNNRLEEIDERTSEIISLGINYDTGSGVKNFSLSLVAQHNLDAIGGNFSDNVIEYMKANLSDVSTAYLAIQSASYPVSVSTSDGSNHEYLTHTDLMNFKNASFALTKSIYNSGQTLRSSLLAVPYGDFSAIDSVQDNR